jgi:hypothetical protein
MCIFVSARLQSTAAPEAPAPMIRAGHTKQSRLKCVGAINEIRVGLSTACCDLLPLSAVMSARWNIARSGLRPSSQGLTVLATDIPRFQGGYAARIALSGVLGKR